METARATAQELVQKARDEAQAIGEAAQREAEQLLAEANARPAEHAAEPEPEPVAEAEPEPETPTDADAEPEAAAPIEAEAEAEAPAPEPEPTPKPRAKAGFTPPPISLEDLAAASRPTKFSMGRSDKSS
jgi:hypothetical protein